MCPVCSVHHVPGTYPRRGTHECVRHNPRGWTTYYRRRAAARFEEERFEAVLFLVDLLAAVRLEAVFFAARLCVLFDAVFFLRVLAGMFAPERRASLKPMAIACLGFFTLPPLPLFNS